MRERRKDRRTEERNDREWDERMEVGGRQKQIGVNKTKIIKTTTL